MSLSAEILYPLAASSVTREYCLKHPLKYFATRYSQKSSPSRARDATPICVLVGTAVGCTSHLWIPVIKHLYRMQEQQDSPIHILSIWVVDRPNHGDAAVLNAETIDKHYHDFFPSAEYGAAMSDLVHSGLLSAQETDSLVALGHSGGGASIMDSIPLHANGPYKLIIMMEPVYVPEDPKIAAAFSKVGALVASANAKEATSWPSVDIALEYIKKRMPWRVFDAENLRILAETAFRPLPADDGVATKTPSTQRTASFVDIRSAYIGTERVINMLPDVPFHAIVGSVHDLWPEVMNKAIAAKLEGMQKIGLGLTTVDAGHYLAHEKPEASAVAIFGALSRMARRARL
ncbi:hypothetical protein OF83DRAFT_1148653 [Amylostereum chailletii]|nr:hypothetical protein OF83DRAFT_1148653 [Amylostereum chailletii]